MNNRIVIIGILIVLVVGLGGVSAYLLFNQKHPVALTTTVNNTTVNSTNSTPTNQTNSTDNQNNIQPTTQNNTPNRDIESPDRIAEFTKEFPHGDGPPANYTG
jgi:hypothetical protein